MSQTWENARLRGVARVGTSVAALAHRASIIANLEGQDPRYTQRSYSMGGQPVVIRTPRYMR